MDDLDRVNWNQSCLVFLDEVSFESRDMHRSHGYSPRGQKLVLSSDTMRSQRILLLCFTGVTGLLKHS